MEQHELVQKLTKALGDILADESAIFYHSQTGKRHCRFCLEFPGECADDCLIGRARRLLSEIQAGDDQAQPAPGSTLDCTAVPVAEFGYVIDAPEDDRSAG